MSGGLPDDPRERGDAIVRDVREYLDDVDGREDPAAAWAALEDLAKRMLSADMLAELDPDATEHGAPGWSINMLCSILWTLLDADVERCLLVYTKGDGKGVQYGNVQPDQEREAELVGAAVEAYLMDAREGELEERLDALDEHCSLNMELPE